MNTEKLPIPLCILVEKKSMTFLSWFLCLFVVFLIAGTSYTILRLKVFWKRPVLKRVETTLPPKANVTTVFFAGLGADFNQAARMVGPEGILIQSHGVVRNPSSSKLIHHVWLGKTGDAGTDVQPYGVFREIPWWWPSSLYCLFLYAVTLIENTVPAYHNVLQYNVAQEDDVQKAHAMILDVIHARPHHDLVLCGTSRGASVNLQAAARLTQEQVAHVKLLILESVFDDARVIMHSRYGRWIGDLLHSSILPRVTKYSPVAVTPLDVARNFLHKEIPIVVITSRVDWHVPMASSLRVYTALKETSGVKDVQLLVLDHSPHSDYATDNDKDREAYSALLQSYYDRL